MSAPQIRGSLQRRLLVLLLAGAVALALILYAAVQTVARDVARQSQDNVLAASALSIVDSARFSGGQLNVDLPYAALSMLDTVSDERVFYAIYLTDEFLSGYENLPEAAGPGSPAYLSVTFLGAPVRLATVRRSVSTDIGQRELRVSVAQTLSGQRQTLARISRQALAMGGGVFGLCVLLALVVAQSTIRPLQRLTGSVSRRGPQDLRPVRAEVPREMGPLVASLNTLMTRLKNSLARSEDFIAEAAHRVRTPLALVRTKAEILDRQTSDPDHKAAIQEMIHAVDDSSRTATQLLDHAMVTFRMDSLSREDTDLAQLLRETVERQRPSAELKDISLGTCEFPAIHIKCDPILLQNALHNLLDNAIKYAPSGSIVEIGLEVADDTARVRVADTGPGFPAAELDKLTDRFTRGSNATEIVGSGLGMTIALDVTRAHGGHMDISNIAGGGACVTLSFPLP